MVPTVLLRISKRIKEINRILILKQKNVHKEFHATIEFPKSRNSFLLLETPCKNLKKKLNSFLHIKNLKVNILLDPVGVTN